LARLLTHHSEREHGHFTVFWDCTQAQENG
jgi:hypothetical protein